MKIPMALTVQCLIYLPLVNTFVLRQDNHQSYSDIQTKAFDAYGRTANDKLDQIGSVNQASDVDNKIKVYDDKIDKGNRLNGVQSVFSNYVSFMRNTGNMAGNSDKTVSSRDETNGANDLHTRHQAGLQPGYTKVNSVTKSIKSSINKSERKPTNVNNSNLVASRRKRSMKAELNRQTDYAPTHRRRDQRGIRSSVADRIAHGFGKRGGAGIIFGIDDNHLANFRSLMEPAAADQVESDKLEDEADELLKMYQTYKDKTQNSIRGTQRG